MRRPYTESASTIDSLRLRCLITLVAQHGGGSIDAPDDPVLAGLAREYRSGNASLDEEFFRPCLARCLTYDRAVGYFTSYALRAWAEAVPRMLREGVVSARLIVGPTLDPDDLAMLKTLQDPAERAAFRQRVADSLLDQAVEQMRAGSDAARLQLFGQLVANNRLLIKFAFPNHIEDAGPYHEKFGVFEFEGGFEVAFTGSANETAGGYRRNFEQVDVFRSWLPEDADRVLSKKSMFQDTWEERAPGLDVTPPSREALDRVARHADPQRSDGQRRPQPPEDLWRHQEEAEQRFLATADHRGVLEMATGTGKTRTGLRIANSLLSDGAIQGLVISTSGTDLLEQWYHEILRWPTAADMAVYRHYGTHHDIGRFTLAVDKAVLVCSRQALAQLAVALSDADKSRLMIIHDEVHGFGSPSMVRDLGGFHAGFEAVLGLSATPEREYDSTGNEFIDAEIGPVFYRFGLEEAIRRGILAPFNYNPVEYELSTDDRRRLSAVFAAESAAKQAGRPMSEEEVARAIALVYKTAELKPTEFRTLVDREPQLLRASILFVETKDYGLQFVPSIALHTTAYSTYFEDDPASRLAELSRGDLQCLICCQRLSEGVDVRHLRTVILASSDRARLQTIQRIGRTLRTDPADPQKEANVVDFVLHDAAVDHPDTARRQWLEELSRIRPEDW